MVRVSRGGAGRPVDVRSAPTGAERRPERSHFSDPRRLHACEVNQSFVFEVLASLLFTIRKTQPKVRIVMRSDEKAFTKNFSPVHSVRRRPVSAELDERRLRRAARRHNHGLHTSDITEVTQYPHTHAAALLRMELRRKHIALLHRRMNLHAVLRSGLYNLHIRGLQII